MKERAILFFLVPLLFVVAGCGTYGKLRLESGPGETVTTQQLKDNWDKYRVLATGVEPNVPSAVLFDRKDDGREILGERWWELKDAAAVAETVARVEAQEFVAQYYPRLWKILGPDEHLYGYMVTAWDHAVMTIKNDQTMRVFDLPVPPFMAVNGGARATDRR